ncbi:metalloprotease, partial [Coemansia spiralis]
YYFSVANAALEGALDRFARFFIDPLFTPDCVDRELHAVDSEHKGNLQSDSRRLFQIQRTLADPAHPLSQFSTGSIHTLQGSARRRGLNLRQEMVRFYDQAYSADIMALAIVGNHSVDQLVEWAVAKFSGIASKGRTTPPLPRRHPLGPAVLGKMVHYETIGSQRLLTLEFGLPELRARYKTGVARYIVSLVESRTPGSIHHLLKERDWATHVRAHFGSLDHDGFAAFEVEILLTPLGHTRYEDVVHAVLAYLQMLAEHGPQARLSQELGTMAELEHRFFDPPDSLTWANHLTSRSGNPHVPPEDYLAKGLWLQDFGPADIATVVAHLRPQNYRAFLGTRAAGTDSYTEREPHYGTPYRVANLPPRLTCSDTSAWDEMYGFGLPAPNRFLPLDVAVLGQPVPPAQAALAPVLLRRTAGDELWFKQDDRFATPQGNIKLQLALANLGSTPRDRAAADLYGVCIIETLHEELHPATLAGLAYTVACSESLVDIQVSGFSSKLPLLLTTIVRRVTEFVHNERTFNTSQSLLRETYQNTRVHQPYVQAYQDGGKHTNLVPHWAAATLGAELDGVTSDCLQAYADLIARSPYVKILVIGNFDEAGALDAARQARAALGVKPATGLQHAPPRNVDFAPGHYVHHAQMSDSGSLNGAAVCTVYFGPVANITGRMVLSLLSAVVETPFFNQLRTQEQLGYIAFATYDVEVSGRVMLSFVVQSERNPTYLMQRIDNFARGIRQRLVDYTDDEFARLVESQISRKSEAPKSIDREAWWLWNRIAGGDYYFARIADEAACLRTLRKEDLLATWDHYANPDTATNYMRIDRLLWPAAARAPSLADLETHIEDTIALLGCLESAGLRGATLTELDAAVGAAAVAGGTSHALKELAGIYAGPVTGRNDTQVSAMLSANGSCDLVALDTALAARGGRRPAAAATVTRQTPDGKHIIADIDKFKAVHPLHDLPVPAMALEPKYRY